ncbi:hypothetical protein [Roseicitreum antarcticum]|uniref:Multisubunit Na+/H+ antiporter, MnhF subunit n=1 Tax=Roseicitreum antarcticum TaxID=564137 RepID=A0A1H3D7N7_9RHOB|nr:hypothetical protein [Roseicitreum antarcticum]SDX61699.1 Multisubunit Na+/H+ antiporter, MnhF subunit [Roseicitreum antarcticum]
MTHWLHLVAMVLLASLGAALWRVWRGPSQADRMMAVQLVGTGGVAVLIVLAAAQDWTLLVVALALALLAALAAVGFVQAETPDGAGDPEELSPGGDIEPQETTRHPPRAGNEAHQTKGGQSAQDDGRPGTDGQPCASTHRHRHGHRHQQSTPSAGNQPRASAVGTAPPARATENQRRTPATGSQNCQPAAGHQPSQPAAGHQASLPAAGGATDTREPAGHG